MWCAVSADGAVDQGLFFFAVWDSAVSSAVYACIAVGCGHAHIAGHKAHDGEQLGGQSLLCVMVSSGETSNG